MHSNYDQVLTLTQSIYQEPELGYKEYKTKEKIIAYLAKYPDLKPEHFSTTGLRYRLNQGHSHTLGLVAELDAVYAPKHFQADPLTGAAHNCGHFSQVGIMLSLVDYLLQDPSELDQIDYNIELIFVPAEEYLDLDYRRTLKDQGIIEFYGGKQEAIRLGVFDQLDLAVCVHAISDALDQPTIEVNCDLAGFLYKYMTFRGRPSHAGFDPFSGINAYHMTTLFHTALGLGRQQFSDQYYVRVNPILMDSPMTTNIIPDQVKIGTDIRTNDLAYMQDLSKRLDQMAQGAAFAFGGQVDILTEMGYLPFVQNRAMNQVVLETYEAFQGIQAVIKDRGTVAAAGDIGDLSYLVPTIQIGYSGFEGTIHGNDFKMTDPVFVLDTFPRFLLAYLLNLKGKVGDLAVYKKSKEDYLSMMRALDHKT